MPLRVPDSVWTACPREPQPAAPAHTCPREPPSPLTAKRNGGGSSDTACDLATTVKLDFFAAAYPDESNENPHLHSVWPLAKPKKPGDNEPHAVTKKPCGYGAKRNPAKRAGGNEKRRLQQPTCPCESQIPFGLPALASHNPPYLFTPALAS